MSDAIREELIRSVDLSVESFYNSIRAGCNSAQIHKSNTKEILQSRNLVFEAVLKLHEFYVKSLEKGVVPSMVDYEIEESIDNALRAIQSWFPFL